MMLVATPDDPFAHDWISHSTQLRGPVTNATLYAALEEVNWSFDGGVRRDLVGRRVCERNWEAAIGEKPTRLYGQ
jgi:methionine-rich copper-binding protein CopC